MRCHWIRGYIAAFGIACAGSAQANEVVTYNYDAQGRLVGTSITGSVNDGLNTAITYDAAGNRLNYSVAGVTPAPAFSVSDATVVEGGVLTFTVLKTGATASSYSVTYGTA
ncbi:MAG: hypothetical protein QOJ91_2317, partial [Sphingomonadales bacterium]|nr:hypothetical protein [Sphingomonadales bacterium]